MFESILPSKEILLQMLKLSSEISSPITTGDVKPSISNEQLEQILTHELAHVKRYDFLTNIFFQFIQCLFFFHPLIWLANRMLRIERERICDQWVIYILKQPESYARCLFNLARGRMLETSIAPAAIGIMHVKSKMRRIEMIMNIAKGTVPKLTWKNIMLTSVMVVVMLSITSWVGSTGEVKAERAEREKREQGDRREGEKCKFISEDALRLMQKAEQLDREGKEAHTHAAELKEKAIAIEREARRRVEAEKREQAERVELEKRKQGERRGGERREGEQRKFISEDALHLMQRAEELGRESKQLREKAMAIEREARSRREKAERAEREKREQGEQERE